MSQDLGSITGPQHTALSHWLMYVSNFVKSFFISFYRAYLSYFSVVIFDNSIESYTFTEIRLLMFTEFALSSYYINANPDDLVMLLVD